MEKLTMINIDRYLELHDRLSKEDPYVLQMTKEQFIQEKKPILNLGKLQIFLLTEESEDIGFIEVSYTKNNAFIEHLYVIEKQRSSSTYQRMLDLDQISLNQKEENQIQKIKYVGVNNNPALTEAFAEKEFRLHTEHVQMEKELCEKDQITCDIKRKTFYQINEPEWIYKFMEECMRGNSFNYSIQEIREVVKGNNDLSSVFFTDDNAIGFIIAFINEKRNLQEGKQVIYIEEIAVDRAYRGQGFGTAILKWVMSQGLERGMNLARLHVYRDNQRAFQLYHSLGFKEVKSVGHWVWNKR